MDQQMTTPIPCPALSPRRSTDVSQIRESEPERVPAPRTHNRRVTQLVRAIRAMVPSARKRDGYLRCVDVIGHAVELRVDPIDARPGVLRVTIDPLVCGARGRWEVRATVEQFQSAALIQFIARAFVDPTRAGAPEGIAVEIHDGGAARGASVWTMAALACEVLP
jgi:hypothetical protein